MNKLKELRENKGLKQFEVVFESKNYGYPISRASLSALENGKKKRVTIQWIKTLQKIYDCSFKELIEAILEDTDAGIN